MARIREVLSGEGTTAVQGEIPGTEQETVAAIERAADKYDEKRRLWQGVGNELTTLKTKLAETVHQNADKVDVGEINGTKVYSYKRGDYNVVVTEGRDKVKVKIAGEDDDEGGGE